MTDITEPASPRGSRLTPWRIAGGALVVVLVIALMVLLVENDASGQAPETDDSIGTILRQDGYLVGFALIYIEESGVPLFIPGDAFLVYVGHRLPHNVPVFLVAWVGFVLAVTFGSTNLYLLSRRYGRRLLEHRLAGLLHLTPARLDTAERSFRRWGPWALIFGRHILGLRVPLTVAAGVLKLPYRTFAISVAVSAAAWAGFFLLLGAIFGASVERSIRTRPLLYGAGGAAIVLVVVVIAIVRYRLRPSEGPAH
ncbi:MAG TPA: VTT domain-containing protein [Candidatus Dormibacteraeota bacterium]|nr:VTT domain-containing protein [Candidatus Dormibacteraeota bacterium]